MLWLTTVKASFNKGTLRKCWDLGWKGVGGERRCRRSLVYLWKNLGYALTKARKNSRSLEKRRYHLSGVVLSRKRWSRIIHDGMKTSRSFQRRKRVTTVVSGCSVKCNAIFPVCDLSVLGFKKRCCWYVQFSRVDTWNFQYMGTWSQGTNNKHSQHCFVR